LDYRTVSALQIADHHHSHAADAFVASRARSALILS
jgi:hypothetical protein